MLLAIAIEPRVLVVHGFFIFIMLVPTLIFLYLVVRRPEMLHVDNFFKKEWEYFRNSKGQQRSSNRPRSVEKSHRRSSSILTETEELDAFLDKVNRKGLNSLTEVERSRVEYLSRKL